MTSFEPQGAARAKRKAALLLGLAAITLPLGSAHSQSTPGDWIEVRGGAWPVDTGIFVEMATRLQKAADAAPKAADAKAIAMDSYTLQYQGVVQDGTKMVRILGACKVDDAMMTKLRTQWNVASSGGACYFEADYNPSSKSYTKFSFSS